MRENRHIHVVSFDIPYPPDYGGIIDVFYKIKYLYEAGFKIILHCFQYNNKPTAAELEKYCEKIFYYPRNVESKKHLSLLPYTVTSRICDALLKNLLSDTFPILFETLHTSYFIQHPELKNRKKLLRLSNIEHHYYYHLFLAEKNLVKKIYFFIESIKLFFYEKKAFGHANVILPVTQQDVEYVKRYYSNTNVILLPSFHPFKDMAVWKGKGEYLLYHGNLSVAENYRAAEFLIDKIAPEITLPVVIAGKNPPEFLIQKCNKNKNTQLVINPDENEMKQLIQNAHIVWLYTNQATGLKLKLLHSLFSARFIICNSKMIAGTNILPNLSLYVKDTYTDMINTIQKLIPVEFDEDIFEQRKQLLKLFDNTNGLNVLKQIIVNS